MKTKALTLIYLITLFFLFLLSLFASNVLDSDVFAKKSTALLKKNEGRALVTEAIGNNNNATPSLAGQPLDLEAILQEEYSQNLWQVGMKTAHRDVTKQIKSGQEKIEINSASIFAALANEVGLPKDAWNAEGTLAFSLPKDLSALFLFSALSPLFLLAWISGSFLLWFKSDLASTTRTMTLSLAAAITLFLLVVNLALLLTPMAAELKNVLQMIVLEESFIFLLPFLFLLLLLLLLPLFLKQKEDEKRS